MALTPEQQGIIDQKWTSRKYRSAWSLTFMALGLFVIPALVAFIISLCYRPVNFMLITSTEFFTFLGTLWLGWFAANTVQKHKSFVQDPIPPVSGQPRVAPPVVDDPAGGQPKETE